MEDTGAERGDWVSSGHFEAVLASAMDAIITIDGDQNIVFFNSAAELMFDMKNADVIGKPLINLIPETARQGHDKHVERFRATGVTGRKMGALGEVSGRRSNGDTFRIEAGISQATVGGKWLGTVILRDITERLANEEARQLLSQEVDHRAKNALAVVHAIVKLTTADSTEEYIESISGRLDALARAHGLLAKGSWKGGDLREIINEELIGFQRTGQISFEGPDVTLSVKSVQPLSMLFHELATNAVKHGALSVDDAKVAIRWEVDARGALVLRWTETGGPLATAPKKKGFGSSLIGSLSQQLRSRQTSDWRSGGLEFKIELPVSTFKIQRPPTGGVAAAMSTEEAPEAPHRVLVVEDEAIVQLVLVAGLQSNGWEIIGPASTIEEAYELLAEGQTPDAAILDINLDGVSVYPLAQLLQARNIPFVFYSGYSAPTLDPRFRHVMVIGKPARAHVIDDELSRLVTEANLIASRS
jgi:PAS domain S-box-containing protein